MAQPSSVARQRSLRARVERLLNGDFSASDIGTLLLAIREKSFGNPVVRELGDFVAHSDVRCKGPTTDAVRDFFAVLRHKMPLVALRETVGSDDIPLSFIQAIKANFRRLPPSNFHTELGMKPKRVKALLDGAIAKMETASAGRFRLRAELTRDEFAVVQYLEKWIISEPVFTEDSIVNGLGFALQKNGLLEMTESKALQRASIPLTLYAASVMHQCEIDLVDGSTAYLEAGFSEKGEQKRLVVTAFGDVPIPGRQNVTMGGSILASLIPISDCCDEGLLAIQAHAPTASWPCGIELGPDRRLRAL